MGEVGTAATVIAPEGKAFIHGEVWNVFSDEEIAVGGKVQVSGVTHLKLKVTPLPS